MYLMHVIGKDEGIKIHIISGHSSCGRWNSIIKFTSKLRWLCNDWIDNCSFPPLSTTFRCYPNIHLLLLWHPMWKYGISLLPNKVHKNYTISTTAMPLLCHKTPIYVNGLTGNFFQTVVKMYNYSPKKYMTCSKRWQCKKLTELVDIEQHIKLIKAHRYLNMALGYTIILHDTFTCNQFYSEYITTTVSTNLSKKTNCYW